MRAVRMFLNLYACTLKNSKVNSERKVYVYSADEGLLWSYIYVRKSFKYFPDIKKDSWNSRVFMTRTNLENT